MMARGLRLNKKRFHLPGLDGCTPNENGIETVKITIKQRLFEE
jgi:hypothetical protein